MKAAKQRWRESKRCFPKAKLLGFFCFVMVWVFLEGDVSERRKLFCFVLRENISMAKTNADACSRSCYFGLFGPRVSSQITFTNCLISWLLFPL